MSKQVEREMEEPVCDDKGESEGDTVEMEEIKGEEEERKDGKKVPEDVKTNVEGSECDSSNKNSKTDNQAGSEEVLTSARLTTNLSTFALCTLAWFEDP